MLQIFDKGTIHFIIPKSLLFNTYHEKIRRELISKTEINEILTINEEVFDDAEVGGSLLIKFTIKKVVNFTNKVELIAASKISQFVESKDLITNSVPQNDFLKVPNCEISINDKASSNILNKLRKLKTIKDFYLLKNGLNPGNIKHILISDNKTSENHKAIIWGKDISKYTINWSGQFIDYDVNIGSRISIDDIKSKEGMNKQNKVDFALRSIDLFEKRKIVIRKTGDSLIASIDENEYCFDTLVHGIYSLSEKNSLEALLCVLNSKPATVFYRMLHDIQGKVFAKISLDNLSTFPFPKLDSNLNKKFIEMYEKIFSLKSDFYTTITKFSNFFMKKHRIEKLSVKLMNWCEMEFTDFAKELNKRIKSSKGIALTNKDEFEWIDLFEDNKKKALELKSEIEKSEIDIDELVYVLYGLTEEEIKIVKA